MVIITKVTYRFDATLIKLKMTFLTDTEKKKLLKFICAILTKGNNTRGITLPNFKLNFSSMARKMAW
jgi:hypothetical protein